MSNVNTLKLNGNPLISLYSPFTLDFYIKGMKITSFKNIPKDNLLFSGHSICNDQIPHLLSFVFFHDE